MMPESGTDLSLCSVSCVDGLPAAANPPLSVRPRTLGWKAPPEPALAGEAGAGPGGLGAVPPGQRWLAGMPVTP